MLLRGFTSPSAPFIARLMCKHLPKPVFSMRAGTVLCSCWHLCPKCLALRRCTVNVLWSTMDWKEKLDLLAENI